MRNQPKYSIFKNTSYALKGLKDLVQTEKSFIIELVFAILLMPVVLFVDTSLTSKLLMIITLFIVLLAEAINSAIERVVDLLESKHNILAGRAKDVGSAVVFLSIVLFIIVWLVIIFDVMA